MSVKRDSPEWFYMWSRVEQWTGQARDFVCPEEQCGEDWQYMETDWEDGLLLHTFRHRCGFGHNARRYVKVQASDLFVKEEALTEIAWQDPF